MSPTRTPAGDLRSGRRRGSGHSLESRAEHPSTENQEVISGPSLSFVRPDADFFPTPVGHPLSGARETWLAPNGLRNLSIRDSTAMARSPELARLFQQPDLENHWVPMRNRALPSEPGPGFGVGRGFANRGPFPVQAPDKAPETCTWSTRSADRGSQVSALGVGLPSGTPFRCRHRIKHRKRAPGQRGLRVGANLLSRNLDGNQIAWKYRRCAGHANLLFRDGVKRQVGKCDCLLEFTTRPELSQSRARIWPQQHVPKRLKNSATRNSRARSQNRRLAICMA